jgi:maltose alpha-D-glucosyltransferase/alpha-amylase
VQRPKQRTLSSLFRGWDALDERWYENAIIYEIQVRSFADSNGDGIGDLRGLTGKLDYLSWLGVTALWLLPVYRSPWRDDGYDISDYFGVQPDMGTLGDFVELVHEASARGIRLILDLVLNHTSDEHAWFQLAREGHPRYRDFYVWSSRKPKDAQKGIVFPGVQKSTWTYDRKARRYYFHRFYDFQPDLNISNPDVRDEMEKIMAFWGQVGASGFRIDAVPFWLEASGAEGLNPGPNFDYLDQFREFLSWRQPEFVLLGEANVERSAIGKYFGPGRLHMLFNFLLNQHVWLALARGEARPIADALEATAGIPETDQWGNFLRNHDEIDLGRLSDDERGEVFATFAPDPGMRLYDRGIRRRLAPLLGGDRRRIEMALSLLFTLPGTPVLMYGDEIGMGEDLALPEREPVRTPMQWSKSANAGFSSASPETLWRPVITSGPFGFRKVNVADQRQDDASLLNRTERMISARKECPEFGLGSWSVVGTGSPAVFGLRAEGRHQITVALHNLRDEPQEVKLDLPDHECRALVQSFADEGGEDCSGLRVFELPPFGYRWLRIGERSPRRRRAR